MFDQSCGTSTENQKGSLDFRRVSFRRGGEGLDVKLGQSTGSFQLETDSLEVPKRDMEDTLSNEWQSFWIFRASEHWQSGNKCQGWGGNN